MGTLIEAPLGEFKVIEKVVGGPIRLGGIFQAYGVKNANNRIYGEDVWDEVLMSEDFKSRLENRRMVGMLGHPSDGKTDLEKGAILVTRIEKRQGGQIYGEAEVLPTPSGKVLEAYLNAGVNPGISSRGSGDVEERNGAAHVKKGYRCETWDIVLDPSTPNAYPTRLGEAKLAVEAITKVASNPTSTQEDIRHCEMLLEDISHNHPEATIVIQAKEALKSIIEAKSVSKSIILEARPLLLTASSKSNSAREDKMELSGDIKVLLEDKVASERTRIQTEANAQVDKIKESLDKVQKENSVLKSKLEAATKLGDELVIQYRNSKMREEHFKEELDRMGPLPERYDAAKKIIESLASRVKSAQEGVVRYAAAIKLIKEMVYQVRSGKSKSYVESVVAKVPDNKRAAVRVILEGCSDPKDIDKKVAAFLGESNGNKPKPKSTIPDNQPLKSMVEDKKSNVTVVATSGQRFMQGLIGKIKGQ